MFTNKTKKLLREGKSVLGTMVSEVRSPGIAVMLATAGFDFFVIDTEHSPFTLETVQNMVLAARGARITPIVRVPTRFGHHNLSRPLDCGAEGLLVPQVETREQVKAIVEATRYHPLGKRGMALRRTHNNFARGNPTEITQKNNEETLIILQIESKLAIDNLEDLLSVPGIDAALIGPNDLSQSLGVPGNTAHPLVQEYIGKMVKKCQKAGIPAGIHPGNPESLRPWIEKGMRLLMCSNDINLIVDGGTKIVEQLRQQLI
ncbi:MAG: 4-hydroxy-2-oxoheptanedioate aldolase [Candidatus Atribacteria bacterium]|nr:4-hydroxy-2-oxoheptanedioate aldolase [Candidatus Atribacteria bacterium]